MTEEAVVYDNTLEVFEHSFYVVQNDDGKFFAGFDRDAGKAAFVDNALQAKFFVDKPSIKLRPNELIVEVYVDLTEENTELSAPFRPRRRPIIKKV
jgi:hypothetical protein